MNIAIVTNTQGRGLKLDAQLLGAFLLEKEHTVSTVQFDEAYEGLGGFDLAIFLEISPRHLMNIAERRWLFCNPEFLHRQDLDFIREKFEKVLCKTLEAHRICKEAFGENMAVYTGFLARDRYDGTVGRENRFVHIAGLSRAKGTQAVIDAWKWTQNGKKLTFPLTVVANWLTQEDAPEGVTILSNVSDEELKELQNACRFHIQPSETEGWSHVLHEALSVGAIILTTDAPPMNELKLVCTIPAVAKKSLNMADVYEVSAIHIHATVKEMIYSGIQTFQSLFNGREEFQEGNENFKAAFAEQLKTLEKKATVIQTRKRGSGLQIAFCGNFEAEESTENLVLDALTRGLGHDVQKLQENRVNLNDLKIAFESNELFLWVRTPDWLKIDNIEMESLLQHAGIPTVSLHLDKFWGIPEREKLIGRIPFWKTKFVFTADGSSQEKFKERGVNHFWMKPAMSEIYLHPGRVREHHVCDVGLVGARSYHREYPFREKLVSFLEKTYGDRFKHITGIRGHDLNDFYASCKVVVGDCFAAGTPRYWSDRLPETCGRHGFLIHPAVHGLETHPVTEYTPQNLDSVHETIEYWLGQDWGRKRMTELAAEYVAKHDTWTIRLRSILQQVMECK